MNDEKLKRIHLKAHEFLSGIPLHSLDLVELKGGNKGMKMDEIYRITGLNQNDDVKFGFITKALFDIRGFIGNVLGWDDVPQLIKTNSWITRLTAEERERSLIPSGKVEGINTILYCYENEILFEIINRTVHCFWVLASEERTGGYGLFVAIYVKKLNWRTPIYMSLISPIVKLLVYPAMKKNIQLNWEERFSPKRASPKIEVKV